jgi:predicted acyl esterase
MLRKVGISVLTAGLALVFASSASAATFEAHGSMEQVYATGLPANVSVSLLNSSNATIETRHANFLGGTLFRDVTPGSGYQVRRDDTNETVGGLTVLTADLDNPAPPDTSFYSQSIETNDYGYMTTRDGTKLAYAVHPPTDVGTSLPGLPPALLTAITNAAPAPSAANPSPTLVEYSGYGYARPSGPVSGIQALANLMGFTVVDVNMRGTGCSGGAFDFFEPAQSLDGYDVVETVAHQPWVAHGKVGMLGISYGGISQLFTGQTQPPDLAALSPLSVIDQTQTTLYPGGVLNTGFAVAWSDEREHEAKPVPASDPTAASHPDDFGGQPYAQDRIVIDHDDVCKANQALHPEKADLKAKIRDNDHYIPEVADPLAPVTFVDKLDVPSFMACQWTDEQTGGHCPTLADKMLHGPNSDHKWFTFTNGVHTDSLDPETYNKLYDFLSIYVAQRAPGDPANPWTGIVQAAEPVAIQAIFGIDAGGGAPSPEATLPPDPIQLPPNVTLGQAQAAFEQQKPVRVLFDNGGGQSPTATMQHPGWPYPGFEQSFDSWPIPQRQARSWFLGPNGALADQPASNAAADGFTWDAHARPLTNFTGDTGAGANGLWTATPPYAWSQDPNHSAVAYASAPLSADTAVVGAGAVNLWVRSSTPNVDLQATISEIRPDGKETFVQGGWVRTKARALDEAKSTPLEPVLSLRQEDFSPMPPDNFVPVTIPLYYEGHMYRTGSRLRVRISAPNGDQPIWSFGETDPAGTADVAIGYGPSMPSRVLLPVAPGGSAPTGLPPCPGLRGEPCRDYQAFQNATASVGTAAPAAPSSAPKTCTRSKKATRKARKHKKKKKGCGAKKKKKKGKK